MRRTHHLCPWPVLAAFACGGGGGGPAAPEDAAGDAHGFRTADVAPAADAAPHDATVDAADSVEPPPPCQSDEDCPDHPPGPCMTRFCVFTTGACGYTPRALALTPDTPVLLLVDGASHGGGGPSGPYTLSVEALP